MLLKLYSIIYQKEALKSYFIVSPNHSVNLKNIYENLRLSFWHIIADTAHAEKKSANKSSAFGFEFFELELNVPRGSLDRGVPLSPSNPDPVSEKNHSFHHSV